MKDELYFYFFQNENSLEFLNKLSTCDKIINKIDYLISKMIIHEDEDNLFNIIRINDHKLNIWIIDMYVFKFLKNNLKEVISLMKLKS